MSTKPLIDGLRIMVPTFYLYEFFFSAFYFFRDLGTANQMPILPFLSSSASVVTVLYYSIAGLLLYQKLGWKSVFPLIVMGGIQEGAYGGLNLLLTPGFLAVTTFNPLWFAYDFSLAGATILSFFLQSRLLKVGFEPTWATFLFPAYLVYYALTLTYIVRFALPGYVNLFILTLFISYLRTVRIDGPKT